MGPGLDDGVVGRDHRLALAGQQQVVLQVAPARQPDAAVHRAQLAAAAAEAQRMARLQTESDGPRAGQVGHVQFGGQLRLHHQSPVRCEAIFGDKLGVIQ